MALDTVYTMNTAVATSSNDPTEICNGPFGRSVWFSFTPPQSGMVTLSTCGSDFDTSFQVYTGTCASNTVVLCSDDLGPACPNNKASASFLVYSEVTYLIVVGGYGGASGNLQIVATMAPPANDQCSGAVALIPGVAATVNTANATTTNDPVPYCTLTQAVWFSFTPSSNGVITIDTAGSDLGTALAVYEGTCGNLAFVTCGYGGLQFSATNGITCFILVGGHNGATAGNIRVMAVEGTPPNDDCTNAVAMTEGATYSVNALGATQDYLPCCFNVAGVWYTFTPTADSIVTVSACGSDPGTWLQVFSGSCSSPVQVGYRNIYGACSNNQAMVAFRGSAGVTYRILAACRGNLQIRATTAPILPNDVCASAIAMAEGVTYLADTTRASSDGDGIVNCYSGLGPGAWYTFTPTQTCIVTVNTCGSDFWTALEVCSGNCSALTPVIDGCSEGFGPACAGRQASVSFRANAATMYRILAAGANWAAGNLSIRTTTAPVLVNDMCAGAIAVAEGVTYLADTTRASSDGDGIGNCYGGLGPGVWYTFTPTQTCIVTVSSCESDLRTALEVFSGICGALTPVIDGCSEGFDPACAGRQASVSFRANAATMYRILAAGANGAAGNLRIRTTTAPVIVNDTCAGAIAMTEGVNYTADTTRASSDEDPLSYCPGTVRKTVWYTFRPAVNGIVTISTCASDFDTALRVFTGTCGSLADVTDGCNDNAGPACGGYQASVSFKGTAGVTYLILVGGVNGATGNLNITASVGPPLPNDDCSGAIPMTAGVVYTQSTANATTGDSAKDVWYSFSAASNCIVTISTCGSDYALGLSVYRGACGNFSSIEEVGGVSGPACPTNAAQVSFRGLAGVTNWIQVWSPTGGGGTLNLQADVSPPLANDDCSGAIVLGFGQVYSESTARATSQGDPYVYYGSLTKGVWFSITPEVSDKVTISTCGSDFDTILEVYSGSCDSLVPVTIGFGHNDQPPCDRGRATAIFSATANTAYLIVVGGFNGITGNLNIAASLPPPTNSDFNGALPLIANRTSTVNTTYGLSTNQVTPDCGSNFAKGVWFTFVAPTSAEVTLDTCGSDFPTVLEVYTGDYPSLQPVACNAGNGPACETNRASVSFLGTKGTRYAILAGGQDSATGNLSIVAHVPPPPNAICSGAIPLTNGLTFAMNSTSALSPGDSLPLCRTNFGHALWFSYQPPVDGPVSISTCGSDFDTVLQVYSGACGALAPLACNDDAGPVCPTNQASVSFIASAQTKYLILVGGYGAAAGGLSITATRLPPPPNQDCGSAIPLLSGIPSGGNTFDAPSPPTGLPVCQTNFGHALWYTFTPPISGLVGVSTCGSDFDTVLQVFTQDCGSLVPLEGGCNDDSGPLCGSVSASVCFMGTAGTKYSMLVGGFGTNWGNLEISAAVLPPMSISLDRYYVTVSWPTNAGNLRLEFTTNLAPPGVWVPWSYYSQGTNFTASGYLQYIGPKAFFRLRP